MLHLRCYNWFPSGSLSLQHRTSTSVIAYLLLVMLLMQHAACTSGSLILPLSSFPVPGTVPDSNPGTLDAE
jgi:hypothetical protein